MLRDLVPVSAGAGNSLGVRQSKETDCLFAPVILECRREILRYSLPRCDFDRRKREFRIITYHQGFRPVSIEYNYAVGSAFAFCRLCQFCSVHSTAVFYLSVTNRFFLSVPMNSRTSPSTISRLTLNSWLIASTISGSAEPISRSSSILDPTRFRLNIWPCCTSRTIAPSCPCVLRTPSEIRYIGSPTRHPRFVGSACGTP